MISEATALAAAGQVLKQASPKMLEKVAAASSSALDAVRARYTKTFQSHLQRTLTRVYSVKTVVSKDQPVDLLSIYVNLRLSSDRESILDSDILDRLQSKSRLFLYGTGGAGKTMMMKYLLLQTINNPSGLIPIFVEFRNLEVTSSTSLEESIFRQIETEGAKESLSLFVAGLNAGIFIVFLDGLDEVNRDEREHIIKGINVFVSKYPNVSIVVSSRPGFSPQSLETFSAYEVQGLSLGQAVEVVRKTPADDELKQEFIKRLESGLYERHKTFLQIPLLTVMMLLTFSSYADIPDRMSVFYEQAFETLYALHDTTSKGPFKRQHYAGLSPDIFRRLFEAFCYITLSKDKLSFLYSELISFIENAARVSQIQTEPSKVQKDLEESVCLVQQDGIRYVFVHRSFQEYFAAKFALRYGGANQFEIITNCIGREWQNNTVVLMNEIDEIKFREKWILPALKELEGLLRRGKRKHVDARVGEIVGGFHLERLEHTAPFAPKPAGFFYGNNRLARELSMPLSRVTEVGSIYSIFRKMQLFPSGETELKAFIGEFANPPADLIEVLQLCEEELTEEDEDGSPVGYASVHAKPENREWFKKVGISDLIDEYLREVTKERKRVEKLVEEQRKLELEILQSSTILSL